MTEKIAFYIEEIMRRYGAYNKKFKDELVSACLDEYNLQIENGVQEEDAYEYSIRDVEDILKSKIKPKNKYLFALIISVAACAISICEMLFTLLPRTTAIEVYISEMLITMLALCGLIVYSFITRKKRQWWDYTILFVLLIVWLESFLQFLPYIFVGYPRKVEVELYSPFVINMVYYITEDPIGEVQSYVRSSTYAVFWLNFIVSAISVAIFTVFSVIKKFIGRSKKLT